MHTLTLEIVQTSTDCLRFHLVDRDGRWHWQNRVYNTAQGEAGARSRAAVWAEQHGYRIGEGSQRRVG